MPNEVQDLWERVWQIADAQHHEIRDAWAQEKKSLSNDIEERETEIARLESEIAEVKTNLETMKRQVEASHQAATVAEKERDLAIARAETATEQQEKLVEKLTARLERYLPADGSEPGVHHLEKAHKES